MEEVIAVIESASYAKAASITVWIWDASVVLRKRMIACTLSLASTRSLDIELRFSALIRFSHRQCQSDDGTTTWTVFGSNVPSVGFNNASADR